MKVTNLPTPLRALDQWLGTRNNEKRPVTAYPPYHYASTSNPEHYSSFDIADDAVRNGHLDGLGFAVTEYDGFVIVDLDGCRDAASGKLTPFARDVVDTLDSYTEISRSGTGLHIVVQSYTSNNMKSLTTGDRIEVFSTKGFVILTGELFEARGRVARVPREKMREFMKRHRLEAKPEQAYDRTPPPEPTAVSLDSEEARLVFGAAAHHLLMTGDEDDLALAYPREHDGNLDRSRTIYAMVHECLRCNVASDDCYTWLSQSPWVAEYMAEKSDGWLWRYNVEKVYRGRDGDLVPSDELPEPEPELFVTGEEARESIRPVDWLVTGYLERGAYGLLAGAHSTYKSTVALDWALSVATGTPWKGHEVRRGNVVVIAGEGTRGLAQRTEAWCIENGVEDSGNILLSRAAVQIMDDTQVDTALAQIQKKIDGAGWGACGSHAPAPGVHTPAVDLVVIDTLNKNFAGGDENNAGETSAFFDRLVRAFPGACILVVHHVGKDTNKGSRGSSAIEAGADFVYKAKLKGARRIELACGKLKDADKPKPVTLGATVHEFTPRNSPDEVVTGVAIGYGFPPAEIDDVRPALAGPAVQVLAILDDIGGPETAGAVASRMFDDGVRLDGVDAGADRRAYRVSALRALRDFVAAGLLVVTGDGDGLTGDGRSLKAKTVVSPAQAAADEKGGE